MDRWFQTKLQANKDNQLISSWLQWRFKSFGDDDVLFRQMNLNGDVEIGPASLSACIIPNI